MFPILSQGTKIEYTGGRTKDSIVDWINKKTGPVSEEVDCAAMEAKTAESKMAVSYFGELSGDMFDAYMASAKNPTIAEKFDFLHTIDAACAEKFGAIAPGIAISRRFDESPVAYSGAASEEEIVAFAKAQSVPRLIEFSEDYIEPIFGDQQSALILFTEEKDTEYQKAFADAAKALQGQILFVTSGVSDGIQARLAEFIGVESADTPSLRLIEPGQSMRKFLFEGDAKALTSADVEKFVGDFKAGSLKPHLKSEDVPEPQTVDGLTTLVGKTWDDVVKDGSKDVLVKYYAPWCGHCKALAPTWDELAKDVEGIEDLVIAKFDATANEVDGLEIRGYPTLKFYPKDNKAGVDYSGDRDLADFQKWLSENSEAYKAARSGDAAAADETQKIEDL